MRVVAVVFLLVAGCLARPDLDEDWESFKARYEKAYESDEVELMRRGVWEENYLFMEEHNAAYAAGLESYSVGENKYNDLQSPEFDRLMKGLHSDEENRSDNPVWAPRNQANPPQADWRPKGFVTPVKDQKQCGSCWAFSATGSLEGQTFNKTKKLVSLSEQNLVDCAAKEGNHGCMGGLMDYAFKYVKDNGGIDTEASYPYTAKTGKQCLFNKTNIGATLVSWRDVKTGSEEDLESAVAQVGPISVGIDAAHKGFQMYKEGVYYSAMCSSKRLDHGVLAVGYGSRMVGSFKQEYWIVKNSWGESWGSKGYIYMAKGLNNMCGIATQASFPIV